MWGTISNGGYFIWVFDDKRVDNCHEGHSLLSVTDTRCLSMVLLIVPLRTDLITKQTGPRILMSARNTTPQKTFSDSIGVGEVGGGY